MSFATRHVCRIAATILGVVTLFRAAPALASRPFGTPSTYRRPSSEVGVGHSVNGGGRGGPQLASPSDAPSLPPPVHATGSSEHQCQVGTIDYGGRRTPGPRITGRATAPGHLRVACGVDVVQEPRAQVLAAHFYDAHAPPAPANDVAGLLV